MSIHAAKPTRNRVSPTPGLAATANVTIKFKVWTRTVIEWLGSYHQWHLGAVVGDLSVAVIICLTTSLHVPQLSLPLFPSHIEW